MSLLDVGTSVGWNFLGQGTVRSSLAGIISSLIWTFVVVSNFQKFNEVVSLDDFNIQEYRVVQDPANAADFDDNAFVEFLVGF
jgi:hypothetical protein